MSHQQLGTFQNAACWLKYPPFLSVTWMDEISAERPQRASRRQLLLSVNHHPPSACWVWHLTELWRVCFLCISFPARMHLYSPQRHTQIQNNRNKTTNSNSCKKPTGTGCIKSELIVSLKNLLLNLFIAFMGIRNNDYIRNGSTNLI